MAEEAPMHLPATYRQARQLAKVSSSVVIDGLGLWPDAILPRSNQLAQLQALPACWSNRQLRSLGIGPAATDHSYPGRSLACLAPKRSPRSPQLKLKQGAHSLGLPLSGQTPCPLPGKKCSTLKEDLQTSNDQ